MVFCSSGAVEELLFCSLNSLSFIKPPKMGNKQDIVLKFSYLQSSRFQNNLWKITRFNDSDPRLKLTSYHFDPFQFGTE